MQRDFEQRRDYLLGDPSIDARWYNAATRLYERTFPDEARTPIPELLDSWRAGHRSFWFILLDDVFAGFAVTLALPQAKMELLEYLAVESDMRGRGLGGGLLEAIKSRIAAEGGRRLLVECRHPDTDPEELDRSLAARRIAFYLKHGARGIPAYPVHYCPDFLHGRVLRRVLLQFPLSGGEELGREELAPALLDILELSHFHVREYFRDI